MRWTICGDFTDQKLCSIGAYIAVLCTGGDHVISHPAEPEQNMITDLTISFQEGTC